MSDQPAQMPQQPYPAAPPPPAGAPGYGPPAGAPGYGPPAGAPGYGPPAGGPPGYSAGPGAIGQPRSIGACIGLAIITLGIYTFVWTWKTHDEIKRHSGIGVGGPVGFLIYFVVSPVTFFLLASEVRQMLARSGRPSRVKGTTGLWILLPLVGPIVWFVKVQGQLNEYWRSLGAPG
jgi:hypothetical protein